jgi:putative transposase
MQTVLIPLLHTLAAAARSRAALHLEIFALRQQLAILHHNGPKRPRLRPVDRFFWACLSKLWPGWRNPLIIVKPDAVIGWSRKGFRLFWTWKSRRGRSGRPAVPKDVRDLIRKISLANPLWGAPRVHDELLKLGINVSQPTVAKYMVRHRKPPSQTWRTFLANHVHSMVSVDFFTVPSVTFRVFFVSIVLAHDRRRVIHFNVTE